MNHNGIMESNNVQNMLRMQSHNTLGMMPAMQQDVRIGHPPDVRSAALLMSDQEKAQIQSLKRGKKRHHSTSSNSDDHMLSSHGNSSIMQKELASSQAATTRKSKMRSSAGSIKTENNKGDVEAQRLHAFVQKQFASRLATLLEDDAAKELQCCVTYGKPCGCIRKYVLAGIQWKENQFPNLKIELMKDKSANEIAATDCSSIEQPQLIRAGELLEVLHHAAELKKEKCYNVTSEGADGKPLKELRGMIGLGNGRKRSKKYEDYVLEKRNKLRNDYSLCEKAAQRLLGYSINFLYKKLRTNPQKTSRLVATNNAERASKVPRHLISLQQLQEMANNQQSANQCCCRNCMSWLVNQHFDKIVDWRRRLEGSGQRVAQEIVREVLLASASLDGQNSFCQNLVHWVTGCSFKKIRRVRDHLKKDPKTLPEHGLKKYWKDKVRNQNKRADPYKPILTKIEKDAEVSYPSMAPIDRFPAQYDTRVNARSNKTRNPDGTSHISNLNNSNNRYDRGQYPLASSPNPPPNQTIHNGGMINLFPGVMTNVAYSHNDAVVYQPQQQPQQSDHVNNQSIYMGANHQGGSSNMLPGGSSVAPEFSGQNNMQSNFSHHVQGQTNNAYQDEQVPHYSNQLVQQNYNSKPTDSMTSQHPSRNIPILQNRQHHEREHPRLAETQNIQQTHYQHQPQPKEEQSKIYPTPFIPGFSDSSSNIENVQASYYITANPGNTQQDGFFPSGMTSLILAPQHQTDGTHGDQEVNMSSQFTPQPIILLSPALPNMQDKPGNYTAGDFENFKPMMMPLTSFQMYPASYLSQPGMHTEAGDGKNIQSWNAEQQHFMFPVTDANISVPFNHATGKNDNYIAPPSQPMDVGDKQQGFMQSNQSQQYLQTAFTPVAVMQQQGNSFFPNVGWFATPQPMSQPAVQGQSAQDKKEDLTSGQYIQQQSVINEDKLNRAKFYENQPMGAMQETQYVLKDGAYYGVTKPPQTQAILQVTPNQVCGFINQEQVNQWNEDQNNNMRGSQFAQPILLQKNNLTTVTQSSQMETANSDILQRNEMTSLQSIPTISSKQSEDKVIEQSKPENPVLPTGVSDTGIDIGNTPATVTGRSSPKGAPINSRLKRFSRERLRGTIDSPCLPPLTPRTPALTPILIPINEKDTTTNAQEGSLSASSNNSQSLESSVFLFPPTHVSRRVAAMRIEGRTTDKIDQSKQPNGSDEQNQSNKTAVDGGVETASETGEQSSVDCEEQTKESNNSSIQTSTATMKSLSGSLGSSSSLSYMPEGFLPTDNTLLVALAHDKTLPILRLSSSAWCDDNVSANTSTTEAQPDQKLRTPTPILNTPTHQLTPSLKLHTPTHHLQSPGQPLNTPNQALNTPTHQLNTPTQPLNTPTDLTSPSHLSSVRPTDEEKSPVRVLMPAPTGKKRKMTIENEESSAPKSGNQKQIRFHNFTPKDFVDGEVNVSAFRKRGENTSGNSQRRQEPKNSSNPAQTRFTESTERDGNKSDRSVDGESTEKTESDTLVLQSPENENNVFPNPKSTQCHNNGDNVLVISSPMQYPTLKTPSVLQRVTPVFSRTITTSGETSQVASQSQPLNTPMFFHSGAIMTPTNRLNSSFLCKGSLPQSGPSSGNSASTPQIFTFMSGSGFATPMFFAAPDSAEVKSKSSVKPKLPPTTPESGGKSKARTSPMKRTPMTFTFASPSKEDPLQTPSKIQVITPSATLSSAGLTPDAPQIFCFQEQAVSRHINSLRASDQHSNKSKSVAGPIDKLEEQFGNKNNDDDDHKKLQSDEEKANKSRKLPKMPSVVVDPPSDHENDGQKSSVSSGKDSPAKTAENLKTNSKGNEEKVDDSPSGKTTLHRVRSGGKANLVLSLKSVNSAQLSDVEPTTATAPSPLSTPSGIQVVTPTMASMMSSVQKLKSPIQHFSPGLRMRPQPLVVAPICLNPGNSTNQGSGGVQVATPTLFHIISPSHVTPQSPSVLVCPYPSRGFGSVATVRTGGPLSAGSLGSSPTFGFIPRPSAISGSSSGSLLKSALMKKWSVFQFPPSVPTTSPEKSVPSEKSEKPSDVRDSTGPAANFSEELQSTNSSIDCTETPTTTDGLSDKLSGENDPCLSEAAQAND